MEGVSHRNPIEHFDHFLFVADQCFALVRAQLLPLVSTLVRQPELVRAILNFFKISVNEANHVSTRCLDVVVQV